MEDRHPFQATSANGLFHDHLCLQGIICRHPEHEVLGKLRRLELLGDQRAGRDRGDDRHPSLLIIALTGQGDAGVDDAQAGDDPVLVEQLLHHLGAPFIARFVIALDHLHRTTQQSPAGIDLGNCDADALAHRHPHRARSAGERPGDAYSDRFQRAAGPGCSCKPG